MFVLAAPSAPGVPEAVNIGKDSVDLEWTKPPSDGGAPIKGKCPSDL